MNEREKQARSDALHIETVAHWIRTKYWCELDHAHSDAERRQVDAVFQQKLVSAMRILTNHMPLR